MYYRGIIVVLFNQGLVEKQLFKFDSNKFIQVPYKVLYTKIEKKNRIRSKNVLIFQRELP